MAEIFRPPFLQVESSAGVPVSGAKLYFYQAGTTTDQAVYQDSGLTTPHAQPVVADANGIFAAIYLSATTYKVVLKDASGVTIATYDNINTTASSNSVLDGSFRVQNTADTTKQIAFSASSITAGTTRTFTWPDVNGTVLTTGNTATLAQALGGTSTTVVLAPNTLAQERALGVQPVNLGLAASVAASALTVSLKGIDGNDPSATNPVTIPFRNVTAATGTPSYLTITAATSIVISSGSTMGFTSGTIGRLWIVGFNDGGTFRLGLVNALSGTSIMALRDGIYSSTAEGGAGAADSAQVIYTGSAVSSKAMTVLGYLEATEATAGTWATAPSLIKVRSSGDPLPGDKIQTPASRSASSATGTTIVPADDTIPQNTEGDQYMSQAITPNSAANLLIVKHIGYYGHSVAGTVFSVALFRDSTAGAIGTAMGFNNSTNNPVSAGMVLEYPVIAGSTSSTTFKIRAGAANAGTTTFNGINGARLHGGVLFSTLQIDEVMA